jgi:hypothetical protein
VISNAQSADAGRYNVVITNPLFPAPGFLSQTGILTVLLDTDEDGMPDDWELANGLDLENPDDAELDTDEDGSTNLEEYLAGTDPQDPASALRLRVLNDGAVMLEFNAVAGKTYAIEARDTVDAGEWTSVAMFPAQTIGRSEQWVVPASPDTRYFRLRTPAAD